MIRAALGLNDISVEASSELDLLASRDYGLSQQEIDILVALVHAEEHGEILFVDPES